MGRRDPGRIHGGGRLELLYQPFGGWNECLGTLEFSLPAPVKRHEAMQLALEQYGRCPDIIDQSGEDTTIGRLAGSLTQSKVWYFWWD